MACVLACSRDPEPAPKQRAKEKLAPAATVAPPRVKVPLKTSIRERLVR